MKSIYFSILLINAILAILNKKSKIIIGFSWLYTVVLFAGNTMNGDYIPYLKPYLSHDLSEFEIGYRAIGTIFSNAGIPYNFFVLFIVLVGYLILGSVWIKSKLNMHVFFALYYPILVFYDINQVRNFVLAVLLTSAIINLLNGKKIKYILEIILASTMQSLALVYMPLVGMGKSINKRRKKIYIIIYFAIIISLLVFINGKKIPLLYDAFEIYFGKNSEKLRYFKADNMKWGFLLTYVLQIVNVGLMTLSTNNLKINRVSQEKYLFAKSIEQINYFGFLVFPLLLINLTFYRVFRNFSFLNYMVIAITIDSFYSSKKQKKQRYYIYLGAVLLYCIIWKYGIIIKYGGESQINMILNNNIVLDLLGKI